MWLITSQKKGISALATLVVTNLASMAEKWNQRPSLWSPRELIARKRGEYGYDTLPMHQQKA